jgi:hypothetical protein
VSITSSPWEYFSLSVEMEIESPDPSSSSLTGAGGVSIDETAGGDWEASPAPGRAQDVLQATTSSEAGRAMIWTSFLMIASSKSRTYQWTWGISTIGFPQDFEIRLQKQEVVNLRCQFGTSKFYFKELALPFDKLRQRETVYEEGAR